MKRTKIAILGSLLITSFLLSFGVQAKSVSCDPEGAYNAGILAAQAGKKMHKHYRYSDFCHAVSGAPNEVLDESYRRGYQLGLTQRAYAPEQKTVVVYTQPTPPPVPRQCIKDDFGDQACGYNCVATPFKVRCAKDPANTCIKNTFNDIKCGKDCYVNNFNEIKCDSEE